MGIHLVASHLSGICSMFAGPNALLETYSDMVKVHCTASMCTHEHLMDRGLQKHALLLLSSYPASGVSKSLPPAGGGCSNTWHCWSFDGVPAAARRLCCCPRHPV